MSSHVVVSNQPYDQVIIDIVDYALDYEIKSPVAYQTAWNSFMDTIGCGLESLEYEACRKLLGPVVPGLTVANGVKVPGTTHVLDPVQGAFNIGTMIRWLDFNDTWLAAEWGHPSDNLGGILATAENQSTLGNIFLTSIITDSMRSATSYKFSLPAATASSFVMTFTISLRGSETV